MLEKILGWAGFVLSKFKCVLDSILSKLETKIDTEAGRTLMIVVLIVEFLAYIMYTVVAICHTITGVGRFDVNILIAILCVAMTVMLYNIILLFCKSEALRKEDHWQEEANWREKESCNK